MTFYMFITISNFNKQNNTCSDFDVSNYKLERKRECSTQNMSSRNRQFPRKAIKNVGK